MSNPRLEDFLIKEVEKEIPKEEKFEFKEARKELIYMPESPNNLPPSYLVSATYDGKRGVVALKLYEPRSERIYLWYDDTGHKPYLLSDLPITTLERMESITHHASFERFETIRRKDLLQGKEVKLTKIVVKDPLAIGGRKGSIRNILPKAWEADIKYYGNYLLDRQIVPGLFYEIKDRRLKYVETELPESIKREIQDLFKEETPEIKEYTKYWLSIFECPIPKFRRVAVDIEVYSPTITRLPDPKSAEYPVICISFVGSDGIKKVYLLRKEEERIPALENVKIQVFKDEKQLLAETFKTMLQYPFIITFNGDEFDLKYLWHRALRLGFTREEIPIIMLKDFAWIKHGVHIDLCKFFFNKSIQVYAFGQRYREASLDDVGKAIIGIGKMEVTKPLPELSYEELVKYCLQDAEITYELTAFNDELVMKLIVLLSRIAVMPMDDVIRLGVSNWIRSRLSFEHRRIEALIPLPQDLLSLKGITSTEAVVKGKYKGAIVVKPKPGVHFNVDVLDFASLYPSIIKNWNLSYETVLCPHPECRNNKVPETSHWVCKRAKGISSLLIGSLKEARVKWYKPKSKDKSLPKEKRDYYNVVQQALKVILNASYGVFGAKHFYLYCPPIAESTAAIGRYVIKSTIDKAISLGIDVIYGDTDSIFLKEPTKEQMESLIKWSKESLNLDLEIDKVYRYVVFSTLKKNYLGVYYDGHIDVRGLVGKKRHIPEFVRKAFAEVVRILGEVHTKEDFEKAKKEIEHIVRTVYKKLKNYEYSPRELAINVMLGKPPVEYEYAIPQHVRAAMYLAEKGIELKPGDIIAFVKVKKEPGVKPVELVSKEEIDVDKYVAYLETAFSQVLEPLGIDFYSLLGFTKLEAFL